MASEPILIPLVIWDGALSFDHERLDEIPDLTLRSWLEKASPGDLISGERQITVPAQVNWAGDEAPELVIAEEPLAVFVHLWEGDNANLYANREAALEGIAAYYDEHERENVATALEEAERCPGGPVYIDDGLSCIRYMRVTGGTK